eukprot:1189212-Prorocentrum_minimum.AAC.2
MAMAMADLFEAGLPGVWQHGFDMYKRLGGVKKVQMHVQCLVEYAYDQLSALRHSNDRPVLRIYGKHDHPQR